MDTDGDLSAALQLGCALAIVRVTAASQEKGGTRSATAVYNAQVERMIEGALPTPVVLKHFGAPCLGVGALCAIAAQDNHRFHAAWQLRFAAAATAPEADPDIDRVAREFQARAARLR